MSKCFLLNENNSAVCRSESAYNLAVGIRVESFPTGYFRLASHSVWSADTRSLGVHRLIFQGVLAFSKRLIRTEHYVSKVSAGLGASKLMDQFEHRLRISPFLIKEEYTGLGKAVIG
jgi:hypothetical protein